MRATEMIDSLGMWDAVRNFPEQVERAAGEEYEFDRLPSHDDIEHVVVLGMGGSGMVGDVLLAAAGPFMPVPIVICKSYEPPSFAGPTTLCLAVSFSGDTEETIEAAQTAALGGARMVTIASGGELDRLGSSWDATTIRIPADVAMPRAALGAMAVPALLVLEHVGLFPGARGWVDLAIEQLHRRRDALDAPGSAAEHVARQIGTTIPLVYGGASLGAAAALRWKNEINENAKVPSFVGTVPELTHNEICGWGQYGDVTRQVLSLVLLRHDQEHPQVMRRFDLVREWTDEVVASIQEVRAEGDGSLAQLLDLMLFGSFVSLHMAAASGVDPGPIPVLDSIKASLAQ